MNYLFRSVEFISRGLLWVAKLQWHKGYILGLVMMILLLFWFATNIGLILLISILLTLLLHPVKKKLERKMPSGLASFLALLLFVGVATIFVSWIVDNLLPGLKQVAASAPILLHPEKMNLWLDSLKLPPEFAEYAQRLLDNARDFAITAVKSSLIPAIYALSGVVELVSIPFIVFYLLKDAAIFRNMAISFVPAHARKPLVTFYDEMACVLGGYIKGQVAVCLVSGVSVFIFFLIVQLPYAAVFAAISAVGELIPVLGPLAGSVFAVMFAMSFSTSVAIKAAIFYVIMFKLSNAVVYPNLIGKAIRLHPVVVMVGLLLFGSVFGALGMIMAVPAMAMLRVVLDNVLDKHDDFPG
jgi:predicted PurR-regulated permease PerM